MTPTTETTVNSIPSAPDWSDFCRFMPKPRPTTEACSRYLESFLLNFGNGIPKMKAKIRPMKRATAGVMNDSPSPNMASKGTHIRARSTQ